MNQQQDMDSRTEGMIEYNIVIKLLAKEMDRDTAGRNGYLAYFDGSAKKDTSPGYAYYNPGSGTVSWIEKDKWEEDMLENSIKGKMDDIDAQRCENCTYYDFESGDCDPLGIPVDDTFGCRDFVKKGK